MCFLRLCDRCVVVVWCTSEKFVCLCLISFVELALIFLETTSECTDFSINFQHILLPYLLFECVFLCLCNKCVISISCACVLVIPSHTHKPPSD